MERRESLAGRRPPTKPPKSLVVAGVGVRLWASGVGPVPRRWKMKAIVDLCVIPLGVGLSVSEHVAAC